MAIIRYTFLDDFMLNQNSIITSRGLNRGEWKEWKYPHFLKKMYPNLFLDCTIRKFPVYCFSKCLISERQAGVKEPGYKQGKEKRDRMVLRRHSRGLIKSMTHQLQAGWDTPPLSSLQMDHPGNLGAIKEEKKQMQSGGREEGESLGGREEWAKGLAGIPYIVCLQAYWEWGEPIKKKREYRRKRLEREHNKTNGQESTLSRNGAEPGSAIYRMPKQ